MRFTKMQGAGNDYVYVNCFDEPLPTDPAELARRVSDRHFGVGGDGLILICPSTVADARMRMFNADGSEAEMCGNGVRCVAKYVYDHGICPQQDVADRNGPRRAHAWNLSSPVIRSAACGSIWASRSSSRRRIPTTLPGNPAILRRPGGQRRLGTRRLRLFK